MSSRPASSRRQVQPSGTSNYRGRSGGGGGSQQNPTTPEPIRSEKFSFKVRHPLLYSKENVPSTYL